MRIRKCASRLLGSVYFNAQPEAPRPSLPPPSTPAAYGPVKGGGSAAASSEGLCELNRSPWDLTSELDVPNPLEDPFDRYFVPIISRPGLVFSSVSAEEEDEKMEVEDKIGEQLINKQKVAKKMKQDGEKKVVKAKAKAKKEAPKAKKEDTKVIEEGSASDGKRAKRWFCKRKDGRNWHCRETVGCPNALCDYHFKQSRSYYKPTSEKVAAASGTASASSKSAPAKTSVIGSKSDPAKTSVIGSKSDPAKTSVISSKSSLAKDSVSSKSAPASAASNSKAVSSASALTSPKSRKRKKAGDGPGQDYIYYLCGAH